jgi:hypothetical protein
MIDEVCFYARVSGQKMRRKQLGEGWLLSEDLHHGFFLDPHDAACGHCAGGCQPRRLPDETALAEKRP